HRLSGDDSCLRTIWDEICVQVQGERSIFWDAYEHTVEGLVAGYVDQLPSFELDAAWLQTDAGDAWDCQDEERRDAYPVSRADVVAYVVREYVWDEAGRWSNPQVKQYLERSGLSD